MIKHIVLWKLRDFAAGFGKEQNAIRMKAELESLKSKIPQIRHIEVGINIITTDSSYDIALCAEFASERNLQIYLKHPEHIRVAEFIGKIRETKSIIDYQMD